MYLFADYLIFLFFRNDIYFLNSLLAAY